MPLEIGPNLEPAVRIGLADWVTVTPTGHTGHDGKPCWRITILREGQPDFVDDTLHGWGNAGEMLEATLSFLAACAESRRHREWRGEADVDPDSNEGLFPPDIAEWAAQNSDEISLTELELQEEREGRPA